MNFDNNTPIYIQLVEELKKSIISGTLKPNERIASVRDLALINKVNPNTMQKALSELESMKLIYTERTNGKFITNDIKLINEFKNKYADSLTYNYVKNMKSLGYSEEEIINKIGKVRNNNGIIKSRKLV